MVSKKISAPDSLSIMSVSDDEEEELAVIENYGDSQSGEQEHLCS